MLLQDNLEGIQHLAIFSTDVNRSREFYEKLGFKVKLVEQVPEEPAPIKVVFVELHGLTLELVEFSGDKAKQIGARGDGHIDHVALNVKDIDKAYTELTVNGFKALEENAPSYLHFWKNGTRYFTILGPDGEKVEFSQIL